MDKVEKAVRLYKKWLGANKKVDKLEVEINKAVSQLSKTQLAKYVEYTNRLTVKIRDY